MSLHGKDRAPDLSLLVDSSEAIMDMLQKLTSDNPAHIIYTTKQLQERLGKTGRLYNPISTMTADVRKLLRYEGSELIGIDIKSSLPYVV